MLSFDDKRLSKPADSAGTPMQVSTGTADVRSAPSDNAELATQALYGETVRAFANQSGFCQVQLDRDRYVGWVKADALSSDIVEPTHRVAAVRTHLYSRPDLKSVPCGVLSHGARVAVDDETGGYLRTGGGWLPEQHVLRSEQLDTDPAAVAALFRNTPYLWGGCDSIGIDCTGLTRAAFAACGVVLPRDSDMQFAWAGEAVQAWQEPGALQRGDLVFWKGHVGIMLDETRFLHANAHHMAVAEEPILEAIERIAHYYGGPIGARRIDVIAARAMAPDWLKVTA